MQLRWILLLSWCTFMYGSYAPLVRLSQVNGRIQYNTAYVVLLQEVIKLTVSLALLVSNGSRSFRIMEALPYFCPALCYAFNNNMSFYMQSEFDPASFSVLSNLKVVTTAVLYRVIMNRALSWRQQVALLMLMFAGVFHSYGSWPHDITSSSNEGLPMMITPRGVVMLLISITVTSFAGVFTEFMLKRQPELSLYQQNCYLYSAGALVNVSAVAWDVIGSTDLRRPFQGFNAYTWLIVAAQSTLGLGISFVMKHSTNITRLVLTCASVVVSATLSVVLLNLQLNMYFLLSSVLVCLSLVIYNQPSPAVSVVQSNPKISIL